MSQARPSHIAFGLWGWVCLSLCLHPVSSHAQPAIRIIGEGFTQEKSILYKTLQRRGYKLQSRAKKKADLLRVYLSSNLRVRMEYRSQTQKFNLPETLRTPLSRSRAIVLLIGVFLERAKRQFHQERELERLREFKRQRALAQQREEKRRKQEKRRKWKERQEERKRTLLIAKERQRESRRKRGLAQQRKEERKQRLARQEAKKRKKEEKRPRTSSLQKHSESPKEKKAQQKRKAQKKDTPRPKENKTKPKQRRLAFVNTKTEKKLSKPPGLWNKYVFLDLGMDGGLTAGQNFGATGGAGISVALRLWDASILLEVGVHRFVLSANQDSNSIGTYRIALSGGWRTPLWRRVKALDIHILAGLRLDPMVVEKQQGARQIPQVGFSLSSQLEWHFARNNWRFFKRWSFFIRTGFTGYILNYETDPGGLDRRAYPSPWQFFFLSGIQVRL